MSFEGGVRLTDKHFQSNIKHQEYGERADI